MFSHSAYIAPHMGDQKGRCRLSALLSLAQDAAGEHCKQWGLDWDALQKRHLFWAVIRTRAEITRLPLVGQSVTVQTWPMPTTRTAYPRATVIADSQGRVLVTLTSLWVLMDTDSRKMVLPGKSGISVPGQLRGTEAEAPGSLPAIQGTHLETRRVAPEDLDRNGHMNNARYLDWVAADLDAVPRAFTLCYLSEALAGEELSLCAERNDLGQTQVDFCRTRTDAPGEKTRICAVKLCF